LALALGVLRAGSECVSGTPSTLTGGWLSSERSSGISEITEAGGTRAGGLCVAASEAAICARVCSGTAGGSASGFGLTGFSGAVRASLERGEGTGSRTESDFAFGGAAMMGTLGSAAIGIARRGGPLVDCGASGFGARGGVPRKKAVRPSSSSSGIGIQP